MSALLYFSIVTILLKGFGLRKTWIGSFVQSCFMFVVYVAIIAAYVCYKAGV